MLEGEGNQACCRLYRTSRNRHLRTHRSNPPDTLLDISLPRNSPMHQPRRNRRRNNFAEDQQLNEIVSDRVSVGIINPEANDSHSNQWNRSLPASIVGDWETICESIGDMVGFIESIVGDGVYISITLHVTPAQQNDPLLQSSFVIDWQCVSIEHLFVASM